MFSGETSITKRRRISMNSNSSLGSEVESSSGTNMDVDYQPDVKRKKLMKLDPNEQCQQLYDIIRNHKKEDGTVLCDSFIRAPKRRQEPSYYLVVSTPMDMVRIQQKIKLEEYDDIEQLSDDVDLMVTNAKAFYKRSSPEYKDACDLWDLFVEKRTVLFDQEIGTDDGKGKIILKMGKLARRAAAVESRKPVADDGETSESSSTPTERGERGEEGDSGLELGTQLEDLFSTILSASDGDGRHLHTVFLLLPSKKIYPEYYSVIDSPIDLKMIATRIQNGEYSSLSEMEKDVLLMTKNACQFNEPGSQIYKDAKSLKKTFLARKGEIEHGRSSGLLPSTPSSSGSLGSSPGKSERIRNRRSGPNKTGLSQSAITAALQYEEEEEEEEEDEEEEGDEEGEEGEEDEEEGEGEEDEEEEEEGKYEDVENPMWVLYETVSNYSGSSGTVLSEPFRRLPSKRYYSDYYKEIKKPISLNKIQKKIQNGEYSNVREVEADLNLMFENAKTYNRADSDIYKAAVRLGRVVQSKLAEILSLPLPQLDEEESGGEGGGNTSSTTPTKRGGGKGTPSKVLMQTGSSGGEKGIKIEKSKIEVRKEQLKARFMLIYKTLMEVKEPDGRLTIAVFMERPSKKEYPEYYRVITDPIDMLTIEANIKFDKYQSTEELSKDFQRMFTNCRLFNEEGSMIYNDANKLEQILKNKIRELGPDPGKKKKIKKDPVLLQKLSELLQTVKDYKDKSGRVLSDIFQKLPSKAEYPDYYEVIKSPMDFERILSKFRSASYESLSSLLADISLMLDNACKFNEPDSQIYKDALVLHRLALQTKLSLAEDEEGVPDVPGAVREILTTIFTTTYNEVDEEGRCFSDTMGELPEEDEVDGVKTRGMSLDVVKSRLDRGYYRRIDKFQRDMFACFSRARTLSPSHSQLFEDSIELQSAFIRVRDEACKSGEILFSPALAYSMEDLREEVKRVREEKRGRESEEGGGEEEGEKKIIAIGGGSEDASISQSENYNDETYSIGDFVYISPNANSDGSSSSSETGTKPNIANIQKLWTEGDGTKMFEGIWFFRPDQTYHVPTRKFLQKEVFRSEVRSTAKLSEIVGKCWVMTVKNKEYFNFSPLGYSEDDTYVCEYRYSSRGRSFTKLKYWAFGSDKTTLLPRPTPLEPIRIASVFLDNLGTNKSESGGGGIEENISEEIPPDEEFSKVERKRELPFEKEGSVFYDQFNMTFGPVRVGDFVYVRVENAKKLVARVDSMWREANGGIYFHGPWFTTLSEIRSYLGTSGRTFYKQEIFQSSIEDTNPLLSICGRCSVLQVDEYTKFRLTEIAEEDTFLCESMYEEVKRQINKFEGPHKSKPLPESSCHIDEIYYFRRPLTLSRIDVDGTPLPDSLTKLRLGPKGNGSELFTHSPASFFEDSLDAPPSISSEVSGTEGGGSGSGRGRKAGGKNNIGGGKKLVTGYILYSADFRKSVVELNPEKSFGEISRIVGNDWRKKSAAEKEIYEERARRINEQSRGRDYLSSPNSNLSSNSNINANESNSSSTSGYVSNYKKSEADLLAATIALKKDPDWIFECCWGGCEWQFEDALDLIEHATQEGPKGHVAYSFKDSNDGEFQCQWKNCARIKKGVNPFPNLQRLLKHVRDIHILKGNGRIIHPDMRSKQLQLSRSTLASKAADNSKKLPAQNYQMGQNQQQGVMYQQQQQQQQMQMRVQQPPEPLFVSVPPRPQKLLHSEAYVRYIESLHASGSERKYYTNWEKALNGTVESISNNISPDKLPSHWLSNGSGLHGTPLAALWALRNFMMRDSLHLTKLKNNTLSSQQPL